MWFNLVFKYIVIELIDVVLIQIFGILLILLISKSVITRNMPIAFALQSEYNASMDRIQVCKKRPFLTYLENYQFNLILYQNTNPEIICIILKLLLICTSVIFR